MRLNDAGIDLIKRFEQCRLTAYRDIKGILTIGWGDTNDVQEGQVITQAEADQRLEDRLKGFCNGVYDALDLTLSDNQFSALVSLAYNIGLSALKHSHLLLKVNSGDFKGAAEEFLRWDKAGNVEVTGLKRRREAERALFLSA